MSKCLLKWAFFSLKKFLMNHLTEFRWKGKYSISIVSLSFQMDIILFLSSMVILTNKISLPNGLSCALEYSLKLKSYWGKSEINWGEIIAFIFLCFSKRTDTSCDEEIRPPTHVFHEEYACCTATELKASFTPWCTKVFWKMSQRSQDCYFSVCFNHWQTIFIATLKIFRWDRHPREYWGNTYFHMGITSCSLIYSNNIIPVSNVNNLYTT